MTQAGFPKGKGFAKGKGFVRRSTPKQWVNEKRINEWLTRHLSDGWQLNILRLIRLSEPDALKPVFFLSCLAGLANAVLLALINHAAESASEAATLDSQSLAMYAIAVAIYAVAYRASMSHANALLQRRLSQLRIRMAECIGRSQLRALEQVGRGRIHAVVAQETNHLSQSVPILVGAAQGLILVLFCLLYIAWLSDAAFLILAVCAIAGILVFWQRRRRLDLRVAALHGHEARMLESLTHFSQGFQEVRLNARRNAALYQRFDDLVGALERNVVDVGRDWVVLLLFSNAFLYALLGVVVFVLPGFFEGYGEVVYKIASAAIFCIGPVMTVFSVSHLYARADIGLGHVFTLAEWLEQDAPRDLGPNATSLPISHFSAIALEAVRFDYRDAGGNVSFSVGPLDLTIRRGELLFVRGGNGAGKSTFLKLLCGLYVPSGGCITVDSLPLQKEQLQAYRGLFTAIFADFHLFERLHGLEHIDGSKVRILIERFGLAGKVDFRDGRFTTLDLSTGQRKRLAMVVALLEDRDVMLFDEWASDQDLHHRELFYTQLLPELRAAGKTVVVVSHDDRYGSLADRTVTLDLGTVLHDTTGAS